MKAYKFNFKKLKQSIKEPWSPVDIATLETYVLRAACFKGEYHWHKHKNEDELFIVFQGSILIQTKNKAFNLKEGEGLVIPKGLLHKPSAKKKAIVLMFEKNKLQSKGN